jgi:hypothetical protein
VKTQINILKYYLKTKFSVLKSCVRFVFLMRAFSAATSESSIKSFSASSVLEVFDFRNRHLQEIFARTSDSFRKIMVKLTRPVKNRKSIFRPIPLGVHPK